MQCSLRLQEIQKCTSQHLSALLSAHWNVRTWSPSCVRFTKWKNFLSSCVYLGEIISFVPKIVHMNLGGRWTFSVHLTLRSSFQYSSADTTSIAETNWFQWLKLILWICHKMSINSPLVLQTLLFCFLSRHPQRLQTKATANNLLLSEIWRSAISSWAWPLRSSHRL